MFFVRTFILAGLLAVTGLMAGQTALPVAAGTCNVNNLKVTAQERAVLTLINNYRAQFALPAVSIDAELNRGASWHARDMARRNYFSHNDSQGRTFDQRLRDCGANDLMLGENITAGTIRNTAQEAFDAWKASPSHNSNMLNASWRKI